jgi:ABC-type multidrug transport system permease subunit
VLSRVREFFREPEAVFWVYVFPILLMVGLGIAFREGAGDPTKLLVRLAAPSPAELELCAAALRAEEGFEVETVAPEALDEPSSRRRPDLFILATSQKLVYKLDTSRPEAHLARLRADRRLQEARGRKDAAVSETVPIVRAGQRYIDWLIPGLVGMNIMGGGIWGVGFVIVDMRMRKLLRRLLATPMRRDHFLLGILTSRLCFLVPELTVLLLVGVFLFGMPVKGSIVAAAAVALTGAAAFSGLGLLIATRARKIETVSGLMNLVMLPMWLVSGVFFSADRFPSELQPLIQALPLTQLNNALRAVVLDGETLWSQWLALGILGAWGVVSFPLALRWFRWE